ncbi:hypothetical protein [Nocardioides sp. SYSU D00038]|uniref:hypothetical protein n=1 Tax=Nocardioides sp. SYSU D00038 TaxID=2812554 RepID=UPI0019678AFA|nr:hypothetical protein [Nocardioides sp. SYSU D00038]
MNSPTFDGAPVAHHLRSFPPHPDEHLLPRSPRAAVVSATVTAVASAVTGILQVVHEPSGESTVVGVEHVLIGGLSLLLVAQLPFLFWLAPVRRTWPAWVAGLGMVPLAAVATISNVRGEDPSFFAAVALPANALWFLGLVALAVVARDTTWLPRGLVVALPLTWAGTIPLSGLGGGVVVAALWAGAAWVVHARAHDEAGR